MDAVSPVMPGSEAHEIRIAEEQPQYATLPALCIREDERGSRFYVNSLTDADEVLCRFELTEDELARLTESRTLWVWIKNFGQPLQPFLISVDAPAASDQGGDDAQPETSRALVTG